MFRSTTSPTDPARADAPTTAIERGSRAASRLRMVNLPALGSASLAVEPVGAEHGRGGRLDPEQVVDHRLDAGNVLDEHACRLSLPDVEHQPSQGHRPAVDRGLDETARP